MKILSKKQVESLFDDIMTLNLIASESVRTQIMNEETSAKTLIRTQRIITERCANAASILKGLFGIRLAYHIQKQYDDNRMQKMLDAEAKKDSLDDAGENEKNVKQNKSTTNVYGMPERGDYIRIKRIAAKAKTNQQLLKEGDICFVRDSWYQGKVVFVKVRYPNGVIRKRPLRTTLYEWEIVGTQQ